MAVTFDSAENDSQRDAKRNLWDSRFDNRCIERYSSDRIHSSFFELESLEIEEDETEKGR